MLIYPNIIDGDYSPSILQGKALHMGLIGKILIKHYKGFILVEKIFHVLQKYGAELYGKQCHLA